MLEQDTFNIFCMEYNIEKKRHGFITFILWAGIIGSIISPIFSSIIYQGYLNLGNYGIELKLAGIDTNSFCVAIGRPILALQAIAFIAAILSVVSWILLLKWNKKGFFLSAGTSFVTSICNIILLNIVNQKYQELIYLSNSYGIFYSVNISSLSTNITTLVLTFAGIFALYGILHIKKDGISFWSQLE